MRASFLRDLKIQESYRISGDGAHHLIKVVRVELHEEILLLNGKGLKVKTRVSELTKRDLILSLVSHEEAAQETLIDLALGVPKKEALELSLKQAVELGFRKVYLIRSQYSQQKLPEPDRLEALLISALEQSNAAFLPELIPSGWDGLPVTEYEDILLLDSQNASKGRLSKAKRPRLLIVGPEGGFSPEESGLIHGWERTHVLHLPTPILRTPTAVATGAGILLGSLLD